MTIRTVLLVLLGLIVTACAKPQVKETTGAALSDQLKSDGIYIAYIADADIGALKIKFCAITDGYIYVPKSYSRTYGPMCGISFDLDASETSAVKLPDGRKVRVVKTETPVLLSDINTRILENRLYAPIMINDLSGGGWQLLEKFNASIAIEPGRIHILGALEGKTFSLGDVQGVKADLMALLPGISTEQIVIATNIETTCKEPTGLFRGHLDCFVQ